MDQLGNNNSNDDLLPLIRVNVILQRNNYMLLFLRVNNDNKE